MNVLIKKVVRAFISYLKVILRCQKGFSILEISIVLIVIGILAAGVLKSTYLVDDAKINIVIKQINDYKMAVNAFNEKFNAFPGDFNGARQQIDPTLPAEAEGQDTGILEGDPFEPNKGAQRFWTQLRATGLAKFKDTFPRTKLGGYFGVQYIENFNGQSGHWLVLGNKGEQGQARALFTPQQALHIDKTLDDGVANSGIVQARGEDPANDKCLATRDYNVTNKSKVCILYVKLD